MNWKEELDQKGYVVIPDILTKKECDRYGRRLVKIMERVVSDGNWQQFVTDKAQNGVIHGLDNLKVLWELRSNPGIQRIFQELYGEDESLYLYIDRFNYRPPRQQLPFHCDWHIDENPFSPQSDYQGFVSITSIMPGDACLGVLEGSHRFIKEAIEHFGRLHPFTQEHYDWFIEKGCRERRVSSPAGSLVLWSSGCVHNPLNSLREHPRRRIVTYVRYFPTSRCPVEKRPRALETYPEYKDICLTPKQIMEKYSKLVLGK